MTDLETLQKIQMALVSGLVAVKLNSDTEKEQEIEEELDSLRPLIVKQMFKG